MDILLYNPDNSYVTYNGITAEGTKAALLSGRTANRTETIANKVVKFLLTPIGSDTLEPEYGAYLPTYTQIAESAIPRLYVELQDDLRRCAQYIIKKEKDLDDSQEKLQELNLIEVAYAPENLRGVLVVRIEVITTFNNNALVNIPVGANG